MVSGTLLFLSYIHDIPEKCLELAEMFLFADDARVLSPLMGNKWTVTSYSSACLKSQISMENGSLVLKKRKKLDFF
jgi:hypothetical protein